VEVLLDHVLIFPVVLIFMISLTSFCQVFGLLWVNFWPKFTRNLETIEWKTERWYLVVGLLGKT